MEIESHEEKLDEIEQSFKEVQEKLLELEKSVKKRDDLLQSIEGTMKQVEDSMTGRYETLQDKLAELEQNHTLAKDDVLQKLMERPTQEKYDSLQSTLMELQNNITAKDGSLQEIERSIKEVQLSAQENELEFQKSLKKTDDSIKQVKDSLAGRYVTLQDKLAELEQNHTLTKDDILQKLMERPTQEKYDNLQSTLMELQNNITARDGSLQEIERSIKELERNVNERDETQNGKLIEIRKQMQAKENTLQEMMRNMTILVDHSKVKLEELEANLNELQNETESIINHSFPRSCKDVSSNKSGSYEIYLGNGQFKTVFCEQTAFGGGWIVFQYRFNGKVDFYRTWNEYRDGFGTIDGEFWLGLKYLHQLTSTRKHELMVEVKDYYGNYGYAKYDHFEIGSEAEKFILKVGNYSGTAGDSMIYDRGMKFTTKDSDNDKDSSVQCAKARYGAWWYHSCTNANLNGPYGNISRDGEKVMYWFHLKNDRRAMVYSRMMLREID
ncbi:angiopoietin-related protein 7-like [Anopheles ziemanni]|uniref:angiopoietin-related protein 7-like n=1 Tax=Anopheles coustani TaxID=139045 RepID=UPI00265A2DF0|nr:angiopoietin-related protein 7-like [Anopheles coustani]XP_058170664.1 angiopoietin-related protein 7-like [Anopheles ziemanni]